jgi:hypothetical protein
MRLLKIGCHWHARKKMTLEHEKNPKQGPEGEAALSKTVRLYGETNARPPWGGRRAWGLIFSQALLTLPENALLPEGPYAF